MHQSAPNVEELFFAALELESPEARSAFLDRKCGDSALRRRVERLLALDAEADDYLETPASLPSVAVVPVTRQGVEGPGMSIGPYKLLEPIGEGGMGTVYMAEQTEPIRRRVALKVVKPGMDSARVIARFEAERQALAMMDHPNIAKVHDGGMTPAGRPYFVMEFVHGQHITDYCDNERLPVPERLELFILVCRAVQHAHQKGIIHRDLKPSNILVTVVDGVAVPKVIDFGIAKATGAATADRAACTGLHELVGTPPNMSPEQADPAGGDVDTRSDVYALGVLLYELLTGTTPFDREALGRVAPAEMWRIIREEDPPRPSARLSSLGETLATVSADRRTDPRRLIRSVRGELDWVVMRALEKDRERRYDTAGAFAGDVRRYLDDQPVDACPPSARYRLAKFARRNRAMLTTIGLVALSLVGWAASATYLLVENRKQTGRADRNAVRLAATLGSQAERLGEEFALARSGLTAFGADLIRDAADAIEAGTAENAGIGSLELGATLNRLAQIRLLLGNVPAALRHSERAEAVFAALPPGPEASAGLAAAWLQSGRLLAALDRYPEARERAERAAGLLRSLVAGRPADPELRFRLARAELNLGNIALRDRPDEAVARYRTALDHVTTLRRAADRPVYLEWDARTRSNLGLVLGQLGRDGEAVRLQSEAVALAEQLAAPRSASIRPLDCLATCRNNLGEALAKVGRSAEAEAAFRGAIEPYRELASRLPDETEGPWGVAMVQTNLADVLGRQGRWREAMVLLREAGGAFTRLLLGPLSENPDLRLHVEQHRRLLDAAREHLEDGRQDAGTPANGGPPPRGPESGG